MHYKNGRPAQNGDVIVNLAGWPTANVGVLYGAVAGKNCCNGRIAQTNPQDTFADLNNCLHIDDIAAATIPAPAVPEVPCGTTTVDTGSPAVVAAVPASQPQAGS